MIRWFDPIGEEFAKNASELESGRKTFLLQCNEILEQLGAHAHRLAGQNKLKVSRTGSKADGIWSWRWLVIDGEFSRKAKAESAISIAFADANFFGAESKLAFGLHLYLRLDMKKDQFQKRGIRQVAAGLSPALTAFHDGAAYLLGPSLIAHGQAFSNEAAELALEDMVKRFQQVDSMIAELMQSG